MYFHVTIFLFVLWRQDLYIFFVNGRRIYSLISYKNKYCLYTLYIQQIDIQHINYSILKQLHAVTTKCNLSNAWITTDSFLRKTSQHCTKFQSDVCFLSLVLPLPTTILSSFKAFEPLVTLNNQQQNGLTFFFRLFPIKCVLTFGVNFEVLKRSTLSPEVTFRVGPLVID